jgi:DNA polymerase III epsilon subunit-like protein
MLRNAVTGITDEFLRVGGCDPHSGLKRGTARGFRDVYLDFQSFCKERARGKSMVLVAHNAKFDIRMINGELNRWRFSAQNEHVPMLGDTFRTSLDTLRLFRHQKMWGSVNGQKRSLPQPSSFKLSDLYSYVFNDSIENSHNAIGDVMALDHLLVSGPFTDWRSIADNIQEPFVSLVSVSGE